MSLVETDWLEKNLDRVKIIDCSWHMPQSKRSGFEEYKSQHIPNCVFLTWMKIQKKYTSSSHACRKRRLGKNRIKNGNRK